MICPYCHSENIGSGQCRDCGTTVSDGGAKYRQAKGKHKAKVKAEAKKRAKALHYTAKRYRFPTRGKAAYAKVSQATAGGTPAGAVKVHIKYYPAA